MPVNRENNGLFWEVALIALRSFFESVFQSKGAAENERKQGVKGGPAEEEDEVADVSLAHARAHPGTVVVVNLDTDPTGGAVEGPRRPDYFAAVTVGKKLGRRRVR